MQGGGVSGFKFNLAGSAPQVVAKGGTIQEANQSTFPGLAGNGLAVYFLTLEPNAVRIPHWHPDASELDYVLEGKARIGLAFPDGEWQRFDVEKGEIAVLPQGWFHYIQNIGTDVLRMLVIFNNSSPNDIGIAQGFQAIPKEVLGITFDAPPATFDILKLTAGYIAPE